MPRKKKTYKVQAAVVVDGKWYPADETVETASDVSFLVGIGALKEQKDK